MKSADDDRSANGGFALAGDTLRLKLITGRLGMLCP